MKTKQPQSAAYWRKRPIKDPHRDWGYGEKTWVDDYAMSVIHPHRQLVIDAITDTPCGKVAEIGANCGPNLSLISLNYPHRKLYGIDASKDAVKYARKHNKAAKIVEGTFDALPWKNKSMDVVLADAVFMYATPSKIRKTLIEALRVTKTALIIVDRESTYSRLTGAVWAHPYTKLLKDLGMNVKKTKIRKKDWPESPNWYKYGYVITATFQ